MDNIMETPRLDDFMENAHFDSVYFHQYRKEDMLELFNELKVYDRSIYRNLIYVLEGTYPDGSDMFQVEIEECLLYEYKKKLNKDGKN